MRTACAPDNRRKTGKKNPIPRSEATRFKPGVCPNRRPAANGSALTGLPELLNASGPNDPQARNYAQVIAAKLAKKAMRGDVGGKGVGGPSGRQGASIRRDPDSGQNSVRSNAIRGVDAQRVRNLRDYRDDSRQVHYDPMSEQDILRRARARAVLNPVPDYTKPPPVFVICNVGGIYMDEAGNPTEGCRPNYEFNKGAIYEHIPGEPTKTFERGRRIGTRFS